MFFKRERPETDDFTIKKYLFVKENTFNISRNNQTPLQKKSDNAYSCVSEHTEQF